MANVAFYFGLEPLPDEKGQVLFSEGLMSAAGTTAAYINTPLSGTLAASTSGFAASTTSGLGSVQGFVDNVTGEIFQYRPAAAQTNAWKVLIADTRNDFRAAADGSTTVGQTYAVDASTDDGGSTVTFLSTARVDLSETHATANTIQVLDKMPQEIKNDAGAAERVRCRFAQRAIY